MALWRSAFLLGCLVQRAGALAQGAALNEDHLGALVLGRRTSPRLIAVTASIDERGEVGLQLNEKRHIIISVGDDVVFGNFMLILPNPRVSAQSIHVLSAAQDGMEHAALAQDSTLRDVSVSLKAHRQAVQVSFEVAFRTSRGRQAFTKHVIQGGAKDIVHSICRMMPRTLAHQCEVSDGSQLARSGAALPLSLASSDSDEGPTCFGSTSIIPHLPPQLLIEDPLWQDALAMAIARVAWVPRLQVGALMAVVNNSVRVDFWITQRMGMCPEAAIKRVVEKKARIESLTESYLKEWLADGKRGSRGQFSVDGHLLLQVLSPQAFAANKSAAAALQTALAKLARLPGPEASPLSVRNVSVSLVPAGNSSDAVQVRFRVTYRTSRDRQVFAWEFAADGGEKLVHSLNTQAAGLCNGRCRLPEHGSEEISPLETYGELGKWFGTVVLRMYLPLRSDPQMPEAMAMAISETASVDLKQVGVLLAVGHNDQVIVDFWVASRNRTRRQAAVLQMERAGWSKFLRCTLAKLDDLQRDGLQSGVSNVSHGSIMLRWNQFVNRSVLSNLTEAVRNAIKQLADVQQVLSVRMNTRDRDGVQINFEVALETPGHTQKLISALADQASATFVSTRTKLIQPAAAGSFRGPQALRQHPATTSVLNRHRSQNPGPRFGTLLLYICNAPSVIEPVKHFVIGTIAGQIKLRRTEVGIVITVKSKVLLSIDFWVFSNDAAIQEAGVRVVSSAWARMEPRRLTMKHRNSNMEFFAFPVSGGSVQGGLPRYACER